MRSNETANGSRCNTPWARALAASLALVFCLSATAWAGPPNPADYNGYTPAYYTALNYWKLQQQQEMQMLQQLGNSVQAFNTSFQKATHNNQFFRKHGRVGSTVTLGDRVFIVALNSNGYAYLKPIAFQPAGPPVVILNPNQPNVAPPFFTPPYVGPGTAGPGGAGAAVVNRPKFNVDGVATTQGFRLTQVYLGGNAAKAGLEPGDVICRVEGIPVYNTGDVNAAMDRIFARGWRSSVTVDFINVRDGRRYQREISLR